MLRPKSMPEMASLMTITRGSLQLFWRQRALWWFAVPVGVLIGLGSAVSTTAPEILPETLTPASLASLLTNHRLILAMAVSLLVVFSQAVFRGGLITLFAHQMSAVDNTASKKQRFSWQDIFRASRTSLSFEAAYWFVLMSIGVVVTIPSFLAERFNPSITPVIFELGFLVLITLGVYLYFIKELSCLYAVLGKTSFRSAGDLGFRLFRRHTFSTVLFFFYAALLSLIFSLSIEFCFRLIDIPQEQSSSRPWITALPFGLYFVFDQILRVSFFRSIATTPKKPVLKEPVLEASQTPSGISSN